MNTRLGRLSFWLFCLFCVAYPIAVISVAFNVHPPFSMAWAGSFLLILEGLLLTVCWMDEFGPRGLIAGLFIAIGGCTIEVLGVNTSFPFGSYHYTGALFFTLPGGVPLAVVFAWVTIIIAVRGITVHPPTIMGGRWMFSIIMAALFATMLDLVLEPVAFHLEHYWTWSVPHGVSYYGIPLMNFIGLFCVALVLLLVVNRLLYNVTSFQDLTSFRTRISLNAPTWLFFANIFMFGLVDLTHGYFFALIPAVLAIILVLIIPSLPTNPLAPVMLVSGIEPDMAFPPDAKFMKIGKYIVVDPLHPDSEWLEQGKSTVVDATPPNRKWTKQGKRTKKSSKKRKRRR